MKININNPIYHPLGGGSYIFHDNYVEYILSNTEKNKLIISVGAQPNSIPHFGTLIVINMAFSLAKKIKKINPLKKVSVLFEVVDTAPSKTVKINNILYQQSLRRTKDHLKYMNEYIEIFDVLKQETNVDYNIRYQSEFNSNSEIPEILKSIINNKEELEKKLDPKHNKLRIRIECPKCGYSEKNCIKNVYRGNKIYNVCPTHGDFHYDFTLQTNKLEYNTPLRNLIRAIYYSKINTSDDYDYEIIRITGSDYSGFYQEELLYKVSSLLDYNVHEFPIIVYAPLILDWSGAKVSKSLYVKENAYDYLPKYLVDYGEFKIYFGMNGVKKY